MEQPAERRRRIDRVAAPDLLDSLGNQSPAVLRALRDECREEETRLSYARRVVQGRIDIASTELARRESDEESPGSLVDRLSEILADTPSDAPRQARTVTFYSPEEQPDRRSSDAVASLPSLSTLPDMEPDAIRSLLEDLTAEEERLSRLRRAVLDNLDGLQTELVRRYREGEADVDAILSAALPKREGDA